MATSFADLGKNANDLLSEGFPGAENKVEAEINAKASCGSKVQVQVSRNKDGALVSTFKPTYPLSFGGANGELKAQLSTDGKTKIDTSFNIAAVQGLKLKLGTTNTAFNGGFDFATGAFNSNLKVDYPLGGEPALEAASVFVHGDYAVGAKVSTPLGAPAPVVEGKLAAHHTGNAFVVNVARNKSKELALGFSYFHKISDTRSLASKADFVPGQLALSNLTLATSNKVNDDTTVKARFDTARGAVAFSVSNTLSKNLTLELGSDFRADLSNSVYNVKFIYNN
jgi:hypothetical protein